MKKNQHKKVVKAKKVKKRLSPQSGSVSEKQRPPKLEILVVNQELFLPPMLGEPLPN